MPIIEQLDAKIYQSRQQALKALIQDKYQDANTGIILLFGDFETDHYSFKQERSLYYLTGIQEPAVAWLYDLADDKRTLFIPNFGSERAKWVADAIMPTAKAAQNHNVDAIEYLGEPCKGYQCHPFFSESEYGNLLDLLKKYTAQKRPIFTFNPTTAHGYVTQRFILQRIALLINDFADQLIDISPLVATLRRKKSHREIELLYKAITITADAQEAVARSIKPNRTEYEMQGLIEYMFIANGASVAFPSIVASGKNGTILHYHQNTKKIEKNDLVVVDIGAEYSYYCADITRTYPASGVFTKRQRDLYNIVLDTQEYIAQLAQPGFWLSNKNYPDKSLNHLARKYLAERGYDKYFVHGIGHFLGMDVHDVGDYDQPLETGDVITIEPGIYIPEENIGIRIEDDYWIVNDGAVCLSENLLRHPDDIETVMTPKVEESEQENELDEERATDFDEEN